MKADLHVHSKYSNQSTQWLLRAAGCGESFSEPLQIYRTACEKGMDLVTITDHNSLAGSLAIAHLENTFISEEITVLFPEDKCKIHVLAYNISEKNHEDIIRLRENVYELVEYFYMEKIIHVLAHPLYSVNERLTPVHFEKFLLLFKLFEVNGTRDQFQNSTLKKILQSLTPEKLQSLSEKHGLPLRENNFWEKGVSGGSDDHSGFQIADTYTIISDACDLTQFLDNLWNRKGEIIAQDSSPQTLAHNIYSIGCQFYKDRTGHGDKIPKSLFSLFAEKALMPGKCSPENIFSNDLKSDEIEYDNPCTIEISPDQQAFLNAADEIIVINENLKDFLKNPDVGPDNKINVWGCFLEDSSEIMLKNEIENAFLKLAEADIFGTFNHLGRMVSVYTLLYPYFKAFSVFTRDRKLCRDCFSHFSNETGHRHKKEMMKVAHFTDTFFDINGVALNLAIQRDIVEKMDIPWTLITCGNEERSKSLACFEPLAEYPMPAYSHLKLFIPPLLKILKYCYSERFSLVHSATPGPLGLAALAIAQILKLPIVGTYHTALPQYVGDLTDDSGLENLMWKFVIWYYKQMDMVYVPSRATGEELIAKGLKPEKIQLYPRGIDIERFNPCKRNGFFKRIYNFDHHPLKLIYVGRISKEKNLPLLVDIFKDVHIQRKDFGLVVVGDGPYLEEMKEALSGLPVLFTGVLTGDDLAEAFASSDIFVFPSTTDTFGNVVLEAQASGIPVIITDQGGPKENIIAGKTGYIIPANRPEQFTKILLHLADNPSMIRQMGTNARKYMNDRGFEGSFLKMWEHYSQTAGSFSSN